MFYPGVCGVGVRCSTPGVDTLGVEAHKDSEEAVNRLAEDVEKQ